MARHPLHSLFHPERVAVIGASPDTSRIRGRIMQFLDHGPFRGRVVPVNPSYEEVCGAPCFPSLAAAIGAGKGPFDLAVIAIPADAVVGELERCAAARVTNALVVSSGFAEEGGEHAQVQARIGSIGAAAGMRVLGPNSEGFFSAISRVRATFSPTVEAVLDAESERTRVSRKRIGVVAQSGGMGFGVMHRGFADGLAFSHVISTGNEADVDLADCLAYMVEDPDTDIVALYLECVRDVEGFEAACRRAATAGKPIVALKVGRSASGLRAALSHTGSMAGREAAYDAFFAKHAIVSAADLSEMIAILGWLATCEPFEGRRVGVLTGSGGAGALIADILERHGFVLPVLGEPTQRAIQALVPSYASAQNPVDITAGSTRTGALVKAADILLGSPEIDLVLSVHSMTSESSMAFEPLELARRARISGKPLGCYCYTAPSRFGRGKMAEAGVFVHTDMQLAARSAQKVREYHERVNTRTASPESPVDHAFVERARGALANALPASDADVLCEYEVKALLRDCGIAFSSEILVQSEDEAIAAARRLGYPVVLKIQSPDIVHKTEIGAVHLGADSDEAVGTGYRKVSRAVARAAPQARIRGVLVQKMAPRGYEVIVGLIDDATFVPTVMVGMGGIAVEVFKDTAYWPAPLTAIQALSLLKSLKSSILFTGFRGSPNIDLRPLADLIARVSSFAAVGGNRGRAVAELELNPVIVHADGSGLTIADALLLRA
jgi:acyl-CoA synthetase (NDP forming)